MRQTLSSSEESAKPAEMMCPTPEDIAQLLPGFLHSLNNPLCGVVNSIALLEEDMANQSQNLKIIRDLQYTTDQLMHMVAAMQLFVRDGTNAASTLSTDRLLELAVGLVRPIYHAQGGQISLTLGGTFAPLAPGKAGYFLRGMIFLQLQTLEMAIPPPRLTIDAVTIGNGASQMLRCGYSCSTSIDCDEARRRCNQGEMLFKILEGNLAVEHESMNHLRFRVHIPTGKGVLLD